MQSPNHDDLDARIRALTEKHGKDRSALIPVLQEIQSWLGGISDESVQSLADALGIHPVEVQGVVSFYAFLNIGAQGRQTIRLCRTAPCDMAGREQVANALEQALGIRFGETTPDGRYSLEWASCLGMCDQGPAILVNERVFTSVTPDQVPAIIKECQLGNTTAVVEAAP